MNQVDKLNMGIHRLSTAILAIQDFNKQFPNLRVPINPIKHKLTALKMLREKHYDLRVIETPDQIIKLIRNWDAQEAMAKADGLKSMGMK